VRASERTTFETRWGEKQAEILKVISRNGVVPLLLNIEKSPKSFSQLMFETHLNPSILNRHLKSLISLQIVEKSASSYALTEKGKKLVSILEKFIIIVE